MKRDEFLEQCENEKVAFKTTQFRQTRLLADISEDEMANVRIFLLGRDPRATWNSCKKFKSWPESSPDNLYAKWSEMLRGLEEVDNRFPGKVKIMHFERWTQLGEKELENEVWSWLNTEENSHANPRDLNELKIVKNERWRKELSGEKIRNLEKNEDMQYIMNFYGYKAFDGNQDGETNFDKLKYEIETEHEL